jgi:hypothetical protein
MRSSFRWVGLYSGVALLFTIFAFLSVYDDDKWNLFRLLAVYRADIPFQFRILFPAVANALCMLLPFLNLEWSYYILTFLACFFLLVVFRRYLGYFSDRVPIAVPILILFPLAWNQAVICSIFIPSDLVGLLFMTLGLCFIHQKNWRYFYWLFPLAVLNRETAIYLTLAMIVTAKGRMGFRALLMHTLAQLAVWGLLKYLLFISFDHLAGDMYVDTLSTNLAYLLNVVTFKGNSPLWLTIFGLVWIPGITRWRNMPSFVRRLFLVLIPAFAALLAAGEIWETRIFTELVLILVTPTVILLLDQGGIIHGATGTGSAASSRLNDSA